MDRTRRRPGLLIARLSFVAVVAGSLGLAGAARPPPAPVLRAERWLAPAADAAALLSRRPTECLARPTDPEAAWRVEVGRAAFRDPLLLGGQAARVGLSCEACHRNGRGNPDFFFPGVSGAPGTADVTSYVFSSRRGDNFLDPKPIPDLAGPRTRIKVSRAPDSPALATFIHDIVTQEFDGREPSPTVLAGLVAYVRAVQPDACLATGGSEPMTVSAALADVRRAALAAHMSAQRRDPATAGVMLQAARAMLGDIAERYPGRRLRDERNKTASLARELTSISDAMRGGDVTTALRLKDWMAWLDRVAPSLVQAETRSLYNPDLLAIALRSEARRRGSPQ